MGRPSSRAFWISAIQAVGKSPDDFIKATSVQFKRHADTIHLVDDAWETLIASGMPVGAATGRPTRIAEPLRLRSAVLAVVEATDLDSWRIAPLLARLAAFRHQWPRRFQNVLGSVGNTAITSLEKRLDDQNRYLKLRRIAIANLSIRDKGSHS